MSPCLLVVDAAHFLILTLGPADKHVAHRSSAGGHAPVSHQMSLTRSTFKGNTLQNSEVASVGAELRPSTVPSGQGAPWERSGRLPGAGAVTAPEVTLEASCTGVLQRGLACFGSCVPNLQLVFQIWCIKL